MQSLQAIGLVEGIPGRKGGYKPTPAAYDVLDYQSADDPETVVLARDFTRVDATVDEIDFPNVHDPEQCRAVVNFRQPPRQLEPGDAIAVGPTPVFRLVVAGQVATVDGLTEEVIVDVARLKAPVTDPSAIAD